MCFASCGVEKFIPEGERLYTGAEIEMQPESEEEKIKDLKALKANLSSVLKPEPNSKLLGMRLGLYYYYKAQKEKPGFINKWLNKKFGEEPVYVSNVDRERIEELMLNRLDNTGFFYSKVSSEIDSTQTFAGAHYRVSLPKPYTLETYQLENDSLPIYDEIQKVLGKTEIKKGDRFNLSLLKFERERLDIELKQRGYYNFNPDFLIFEADTNRYDRRKFDLFLRLKKQVPQKSIIPYTIDSITVYPNYTMQDTTSTGHVTTVNDIEFIQGEEFFKPEQLGPYILFNEGQRYNAKTSRITSNRLASIGSYKFVNIRFNEKDTTATDGAGSLNADIFLSPLTKRSMRAELEVETKSNGFAGPGISVSYSNRNLFRGGETLSLSGNFAYAAQLSGGDDSRLSTISGGLKTELVIPRLIPFSASRFKYNVPKTKISLGGDILKRSQLYTLTSFSTAFQYTWKANRYINHTISPVSVNYVNLAKTTAEFDSILVSNPFLRQSFEQQFIAGMNYSFSFNELVDLNKKTPIFFSTSLDIAGNLLNLLSGTKKTVLGLEYAQYAKADIDFRYYYRLKKEQTLIGRVYAGWGIPYGNSVTLPYVKQFFSGGPYSVRAFEIRSLGPGSFRPENDNNVTSFYDQSGNLILEGNLEYRFPLFSFLKGAVFADAGNVWLTSKFETPPDEPDESREYHEELLEKGSFSSDWAKELGVGVGVGLRVDIQSFVIRFDLASPIRVPYLPEGERSRVPFFKGGSDNLILNFAIGYPF